MLPGFGLTLGFSLFYLGLVVLDPARRARPQGRVLRVGGALGGDVPRRASLASYRLTFGASLVAALVNAVFGLLVAWVLVRYRFPGRRVVDALVDLPFALPTAVAGIALTAALRARRAGSAGPSRALGLKVAFTPLGVGVALTFIGLPFVVRTLQPVLEALDPEVEEAAASLGAEPRCRPFVRVVLPAIAPAWLTGVALAFARALGEYGSVVFIVRQHADEDRDRAAPHHDEARAVRLRRRHGDRRSSSSSRPSSSSFAVNLLQAWSARARARWPP